MNFSLILVTGCFILISLPTIAKAWSAKKNDQYVYPTKYYHEQFLDHFNPTVDQTYQQRYFLSEQYWNEKNGPLFFYTGNEGDITTFINNTGFMWDIAPTFQAMVVFAEHRYYGESKPFGNIQPSVNTTKQFGQLTAEQALADYAQLIEYLKEKYSGISAVIAFGGSYGGMLSAWFRIKYPHVVDGAIAASAPIINFTPVTDCDDFSKVVTADFLSTQHGEQCVKNIRSAWPLITKTAELPDGLKKLSDIFHTCKLLESGDELISWIVGCWGNMAMVDYPHPADFLAPLPAWPVNVTCEQLSKPVEDDDLLQAMFQAISIYANYTGKATCLDTSITQVGGISDSLWGFQSCTEFVMSFCSNGVTDMFPVQKWDYNGFKKGCQDGFGVTPRPNWLELNFGGSAIASASNIVFSNGVLDPWHLGGILHNVSESVVAVVMWGAAHHLDLRHHDVSDPASVLEGRKTEMLEISKWISDKYVAKYGKLIV